MVRNYMITGYSNIRYLYLCNGLCIQKFLGHRPKHLLKARTSIDNKHSVQCLCNVWTTIRNQLNSEEETYRLTETFDTSG